jgi:replication factor C subunit 3/5
MTKNAQQALRYLLQNYTNNVRFCLICNYISKIDEGLQNEFIRLRFNQLPKPDIIKFLTKISVAEKLNISQKSLSCVQKLYKSDIRSMVNFMQSNQDIVKMQTDDECANFDIIDDDVWDSLIAKVQGGENIRDVRAFVHTLSSKYNIDKKNIIKDFFNYIIRSHPKYICKEFMSFIENLMHSEIQDNNVHLHYSLSRLPSFISTP